MTYYGARHLADAFRTVRKNTITIAEDIPAEQYGFRAAPGVRTVGELLAHIAVSQDWQIEVHGSRITSIDFEYFGRHLAQAAAEEQTLQTRDQILATLRSRGERFATFLEGLQEEVLAETVSFPPPVMPATKSRLEMLISSREHEMHHRAQLMLIERQLGIVPHLTRQRQAVAAQGSRS